MRASPAELPAVLAIDGGNSKTDIALVAADGSLLAGGRGPGVRTFPTPPVLEAIGAVIGAAALDAGLPGGWPVAAHTVACMANADLPEEEERLAGADHGRRDGARPPRSPTTRSRCCGPASTRPGAAPGAWP